MVERKKRLKKGIASLQSQISIHSEKHNLAKETNQQKLVDYYQREIIAKKADLARKENQLERKK